MKETALFTLKLVRITLGTPASVCSPAVVCPNFQRIVSCLFHCQVMEAGLTGACGQNVARAVRQVLRGETVLATTHPRLHPTVRAVVVQLTNPENVTPIFVQVGDHVLC